MERRNRIIHEEELEASLNYQFSEEDIQFIRELNEKLRQEERRFMALYNRLMPQLEEWRRQGHIDDFNYKAELSVFSKNPRCNARYGVVYGDRFWGDSSWIYSLFTGRDKPDILEKNWNKWHKEGHPLSEIHFCYTFYCIAFQSCLPWEDILSIEDVWLEIDVDYRFFTRKKEEPTLIELFHEVMKDGTLSAREGLEALFSLVKDCEGCPSRMDDIPIDDDPNTWELFQEGGTDDIVHFRTTEMKDYLKDLQPDSLADLETLFLLYRPGLHHRIPEFIEKKRDGLPFEIEEGSLTEEQIRFVQEQVSLAYQTAYLLANFQERPPYEI